MSNEFNIRILSFDPGLSLTGWNVSEYNNKTCLMRVLKFGMLSPSKHALSTFSNEDITKYGNRIMTLDALRCNVRELMNAFNPDVIVSEDAFYNPMRPSAYCALLQWLTTLDLLLKDEYNRVLFKLSPRIAKQVVSGFGGANKLGIQYAITHKEDIVFKSKHYEENLTEHICDSIGIGYTFIQEILPALLDIWQYGYTRKPMEPIPSKEVISQKFR